jgi:molybdenum cofactor cytidylyltransferase
MMQTVSSPVTSAVLLTGGQGSRLGGCAKSLLQLDGKPLVLRQLEALHGAGVQQIVVVTGFYHLEVEKLLSASKASAKWKSCVKVVRNPTPEDGQQSSVLRGLGALAPPFDMTLIVLVDQPLMTTNDYLECLAAYAGRPSDTSIAYPRVNGKRGNPVALAHKTVQAVLASGGTCRSYIESHKELVHQYPSQNAHFLTDIDTLADLESLRTDAGLNLQLP